MYRQVLLAPQDRYLQHIFWRPSPTAPVQEAQLNIVTYGLAPSPLLAVRVIHQLVTAHGAEYPLASQAFLHQTYEDEIVTGSDDETTTAQLRNQLIDLLALGGFQFRKWSINQPQLLSQFPDDHLETTILFSDKDKSLKILGLVWDPSRDCLLFQIKPFNDTCTKRNM